MRISKAEKYEKEQYMIQQEIIGLMGLESGFYLYEMDRDQEKIDMIMGMVPDIWRYFAHMNITGLLYPEKCKRPWLSIVRGVLKREYKLRYKPCRFQSCVDGSVFTMRYFLESRCEGESISESISEPPSRVGTPEMEELQGGTMSTASSCESLTSLEDRHACGVGRGVGSGRRKLKVKRRRVENYQVGDMGDSAKGENVMVLMRRGSHAGVVC